MRIDEQGPFTIYAANSRVCFWGAPARVKSEDAFLKQFADTGYNTGNLFIGSGLFTNTVARSASFFPGLEFTSPEAINDEYDIIFVGASNFLNPNLDLDQWFQFFSKTKLPFFCFGLGSQFPSNDEFKLKPGTENFIKLISERSVSIGVRGAFTAEVLASLGIFNTEIVGCPSLLDLDESVLSMLKNTQPTLDKIAVNFSHNVRGHSFDERAMRQSENSLFQSIASLNSFYILQNEEPELRMLDALRNFEHDTAQQYLLQICDIYEASRTQKNISDLLQHRVRVFFDTMEWVSSMRSMTASIGTRFHGNVAAILAGVPALFMTHDMRTLELCEFFGLPHVTIDKPYTGEALIDHLMEVNYSSFFRRFNAVRTIWKLFVYRNGLGFSTKKSDRPIDKANRLSNTTLS